MSLPAMVYPVLQENDATEVYVVPPELSATPFGGSAKLPQSGQRCVKMSIIDEKQNNIKHNLYLAMEVGSKAPWSLCLCYMFRRLKLNLVLSCKMEITIKTGCQ